MLKTKINTERWIFSAMWSRYMDFLLTMQIHQITLSKPFSSSLLPRTSPMPARAMTGFSPMGSATKSLCFWDVDDMAAIGIAGNHLLKENKQ